MIKEERYDKILALLEEEQYISAQRLSQKLFVSLPTIRREDVPFALKDRLEAELETKIDLPWENIRKWKEQFKEQK